MPNYQGNVNGIDAQATRSLDGRCQIFINKNEKDYIQVTTNSQHLQSALELACSKGFEVEVEYENDEELKIATRVRVLDRQIYNKEFELQAKYWQENNIILPLNRISQIQSICAGSTIPDGWIKVDDMWSPTSCGNPPYYVANVWIIESYYDKPIGSFMSVCAEASLPLGWIEINRMWVPTKCGRPTDIVYNMMYIKRIS